MIGRRGGACPRPSATGGDKPRPYGRTGQPGRTALAPLLLALALVALTASCGPSAADVLDKRGAAAAPSPSPAAAAQASAGDEKVSGPVAVRLNGVQFSDRGNYVSPREGMVFLALDVTIRNAGQQEVTVGSRAITLKDATGTEYRRNLTAASKPSPHSTLPPGKETRGELTYEVPRDATAFQLAVTGGETAQPVSFEIKKT